MFNYIERLPIRPLINVPLRNETVVRGTNITLECKVLSDHMPYIKWLKHHIFIKDIDKLSEETIKNESLVVKVKHFCNKSFL